MAPGSTPSCDKVHGNARPYSTILGRGCSLAVPSCAQGSYLLSDATRFLKSIRQLESSLANGRRPAARVCLCPG